MFTIRPWKDGERIPEITAMLHRAFAERAARGIAFGQASQSNEVTGARLRNGTSFTALAEATVIGTISVHPPLSVPRCAWYRRADVALFSQLAVEPAFQRRGVGAALVAAAERHARALHAAELACDTATNATALVAFYHRLGYCDIEVVQWEGDDHQSIVLSKTLVDQNPSGHVNTLR